MRLLNTSTPAKDGYDYPLSGLDDGTFLSIHILALTCITISLGCVSCTLITSFKKKPLKTFFTWQKPNRFVVYLAVCDGVFNIVHLCDHTQIIVTRDHVRPRALCVFYAATMGEFIAAQTLMVNIVSINAFLLMYFKKNINFGRHDYQLLVWTFGVPLIGVVLFIYYGTFGASGLYCGFDRVKGRISYILFLTVPMCTILTVNIVLYTLIWLRIRREENSKISSIRGSVRAARSMSLFIAAFVIQWWSLAIFGIVPLVSEDVPPVLNYFTTTFSNIGGVLNGAVYLIIRGKQTSPTTSSSSSSNVKSTA